MISRQIGLWKVKQYMLFVCFEETLNINLYKKLLLGFKDDKTTEKDMYRLIASFVKSKKKWKFEEGQSFIIKHCFVKKLLDNDLITNYKRYFVEDHDLHFFEIHQWGLSLMGTSCFNSKTKSFKSTSLFTPEEYFYLLQESLNNKEVDKTIYFALYFFEFKDVLPFSVLEQLLTTKNSKYLYSLMNIYDGKYSYDYNYVLLFLLQIIDIPTGILYEELYIEREEKLSLIESHLEQVVKNNKYLPIPLTALDRHTHKGKVLLAKENIEYEKHLNYVDLHLSGSWFAIIWRIYAIKHFGTIKVKWEDIKIPNEHNIFLH